MEMTKDEFAVLFTKQQEPDFNKIKAAIDERMLVVQGGKANQGGESDAAQLERLASLVEKGFLTREEFEAKKRQILGL